MGIIPGSILPVLVASIDFMVRPTLFYLIYHTRLFVLLFMNQDIYFLIHSVSINISQATLILAPNFLILSIK